MEASGAVFPSGLLPRTAERSADGLAIGGIPVASLAVQYGTPLIAYDEVHLRGRCAEVRGAFPGGASYAAKAFLCRAMARLVHDEGLGIDVASGGEFAVARASGVPAEALTLHGNNKSLYELRTALVEGAGRVVIDSRDELDRLIALTEGRWVRQRVAVRVKPSVDVDTHRSVMTGHHASKFGVAIEGGEAAALVERIRACDGLVFGGVHVHAGSQISDLEALGRAIIAAARFATECDAAELVVGGGLAVAHTTGDGAPSIAEWGAAAQRAARAGGFAGPVLAEPGRAIAATAAVTVYTIGTVKRVDEGRILLAIDGGISDNPRPALYGSAYQPFLARHPLVAAPPSIGAFTVVGKNCESSDTFASDVAIPGDPRAGDLLCLPVTGAYTYSMSSHYNGLGRPAVVMVRDGASRLVLRRETVADLLRADVG